jgi:hypothetical protein
MAELSFIVRRDDLREARFVDDAPPVLADGQVRLRIDRFALTSNNVTYGAFGESMRYWDFFPCDVPGFGRIPVWGFADVLDTAAPGIAAGERFYGYFPMSTQVVLQPEHVNASGFSDGAPHRRELHAVYNRYTRCSADPGYAPEHEPLIMLLRPLYITSFLIDDFLADNGFFGARTVILSSASSKTAYGTAFCLSQRRGTPEAVKVVGLTSPANVDFVRSLGCYDEVLAYDEVTALPAEVPSVYVDFSGMASLRAAVHGHFGDRLAHSCAVGSTHHDEMGSARDLPGPRPVFFFAPAQIRKRQADWGAAGLGQRIAAAWQAFIARAARAEPPWIRVVEQRGPQAVQQVFRELVDGRSDPRQGHVLRW